MTIRVQIGTDERAYGEADANWINGEITRLRRDSEPVCVQVTIDQGDINLVLTTMDCQQAAGRGGGPTNFQVNEIVALWKKLRLDQPDFSGDGLISFLQQVTRYT
jgi:hypothetical protein